MLLPLQQLRDAFDLMSERAAETGGVTVMVLCATDVDALCTCKIVTRLLAQDHVQCAVQPVATYSDVSEAMSLVRAGDSFRSVVTINCGGDYDLQGSFLERPDEEGAVEDSWLERVTFYVIDNRRPFELNNVTAPRNKVSLFDDLTAWNDLLLLTAAFGVGDGPSDDEADGLSHGEADDLDEDEFDYQADSFVSMDPTQQTQTPAEGSDSFGPGTTRLLESQESGTGGKRRRGGATRRGGTAKRRRSAVAASSGINVDPIAGTSPKSFYDGDPDEELTEENFARIRTSVEALTSDPETLTLFVDAYYRWASYAQASAAAAYDLATSLGRDENALLWLAIVGVTDLFIAGRASSDWYESQLYQLQESVKLQNRDAEGAYDEEGGEVAADHAQPRFFEIAPVDQFRFPLYRRWTLNDAVANSMELSAALQTWSGPGQSRLRGFMAHLGMPATQAAGPFALMERQFQDILPERVEANRPRFGLPELSYSSFVLRHGYAGSLAAEDAVWAAAAALEGATVEEGIGEAEVLRQRFNAASDFLDERPDRAAAALFINRAKRRVTQIVDAAHSMLRAASVRRQAGFSFAEVEGAHEPGDTLAQPAALRLVARHLALAERQQPKSGPIFVFSRYTAPDAEASTDAVTRSAAAGPTVELAMCVGTCGSGVHRSDVEWRLKQACVESGVSHRQDFFDKSAVLFRARDQHKLLRQLIAVYSSSQRPARARTKDAH